ncbi:MAG TPA: IPTL-CTERM sorting domain-containing protein, partial [Thermoanaerobaculia bacterium]|nr:IPTL-CTERM sorting domain-containing protein [Thermoanaerobaculia bacterium]
MSLFTPARVRIALALLLLTIGLAPAAHAASSDFRFYVDVDNDQTTGCVLPAALAPDFTKADEVLTVRIDISPSGRTVDTNPSVTHREHCNPGTGLFESTALSAAIGPGLGTGGSDVIETSFLLVGPGEGTQARIGFDSVFNDTGATDSLVTLSGDPGGNPIVLQPPQGSALDIPTLGEWGLLVLALLLTGSGFLVLRRRGRQGIAALILVLLGLGVGVAWAALMVDGDPSDWNTFAGPLVVATDTKPAAPANADIVKGFAGLESNTLFLRLDVRSETPATGVADHYDASQDTLLTVPAALGVLVNDTGDNLVATALSSAPTSQGGTVTL